MSVMQEGEEGDVLARKGLADARLTRRPDSWLRRPGGQGLKVRDGRVQEGKGRTDVFSGLDESEKGDSREVAGRKEGRTGRGPCNVGSWSGTKKPSQRAWREGGGALAPENAK